MWIGLLIVLFAVALAFANGANDTREYHTCDMRESLRYRPADEAGQFARHRVHRSGMGHHPSGGGIDRGIELDHAQPIGLPDALGSINLRQLAVKQRYFLEFLFQIGKLLSG